MTSGFASRLRAARAKAELSQPQLAEKASMSVGVLRGLEQGRRTNPSLSTLTALATALGITITELTGR